MIIRSFIAVCLCIQWGLAANIAIRQRHDLTISECAAKGGECDESRGRPVCGTDDQTYPTRCHLLRVQCSGHQVSLKYRGPCKACKEARDYALRHKSKNPPKFVPRCKSDGTYAAIQCLGDTGCWCSDITGKPIENTSVRVGKPKCREFSKGNLRRSPARHLSPSRSRRVCTAIDRAAFSANLIKVFQSEYVRAGQQKAAPADDKLVLDWKFAYLDANANQMLDKNEFRELKKLVKRAVKPRRCGRAFGKFCDLDDDDRLTHSEWNSCFSKDEINRHTAVEHRNNVVNSAAGTANSHGFIQTSNRRNNNNNNNNSNNNNNRHSSTMHSNHPTQHTNSHQNHNTFHSNSNNNNNDNNNNNNIHHHSTLDDLDSESHGEDDESSQHLDYDEDADYDPDEGDDGDNLSMLNSFGSSTNFPSIYFLRPKPDSPLKGESEGESDCKADQAAALEEQRQGGTILYVPECTADGRYQRVQCYRSTPYCWCVHEDSGKNIPGTSVKNKRPQCDQVYTMPRPMKGCPEPRKTVFLQDLKDFLKTYIVASASSGSNTTKWNSEDERIATLSFVLLDKNKNKSWERKEWKIFRELVTNSKTLRKCGKKMPRYCDVNSDKKITLSEWLNCLQAQRVDVDVTAQSSTAANESVTTKPSKLTGSNPLEQYLKD